MRRTCVCAGDADEKPAQLSAGRHARRVDVPFDPVDGFFDARRYGRTLLFDSTHDAEHLQAAVASQWQLEPTDHPAFLAQGEVAPGLHLNLFTADKAGKYELILLREPQVSQEEAGQIWAETISSLWRLVDA